MTIDQPAQRLALRSVVPVWILVVLGAVFIGVIVPTGQYLTWVPIVLVGAAIVTFCIQLSLDRKEGLVNRMMASLGGSVVILAIATLTLGIVQLTSA
ncbi:hypothetical protein [Glaciihabitans sp. UYNi722]|uniref:hypothetical protein n=1 Tax=Glaciihabitans sp. UYNi722 TaxID=3156344 RepID=UPI0033986124